MSADTRDAPATTAPALASDAAAEPGEPPLLPTMGVGSYAAPGWFTASWRAARKGEWGAHDVEELFADATRIVVADQLEAGVDILTDGELRRQRFVYEVYDRLTGLERVPPRRRLGIPGYDMAPRFVVRDRIAAEGGPDGGLGAVEEFRALRAVAPSRPLKVAIPGPLSFAEHIDLPTDGSGPRDGVDIVNDLISLVNRELKALAREGARFIQLDEPGLASAPHGLSLTEAADAINRALAGVEARTAVHVCFGNNAGRPVADRRMARLMPAVEALACDQLVLEFANREFAELGLLAPLAQRFEIAAGVIDVKNFRVETAEDVAGHIARCLEHVPAERLTVTADCGFSALPRYLARRKLDAMVAGARLARARL